MKSKTLLLLYLLIPIYLFGIQDPYEKLDINEKANLIANYFFNKELKRKLPPKPEREKVEKLGNIKAIKYEQYFAYIQRVKALKRAKDEENQKADEKFEGEVGYYNGNMKTLYKHYKKYENKRPMIQNSINKTLKALFGKLRLSKLNLIIDTRDIEAKLFTEDLYGLDYIFEYDVVIDVPIKEQENFINRYRSSKVVVSVDYTDNILTFKDFVVNFEGKTYKGKFKEKVDKKLEFDIKIDEKLFEPIKL
jgi:hypothetical protein